MPEKEQPKQEEGEGGKLPSGHTWQADGGRRTTFTGRSSEAKLAFCTVNLKMALYFTLLWGIT